MEGISTEILGAVLDEPRFVDVAGTTCDFGEARSKPHARTLNDTVRVEDDRLDGHLLKSTASKRVRASVEALEF